MLFPYTYVPHQMEKMQEFIDFTFFEVWCNAPIGLEFSPTLFEALPDLRDVVSFFGFAATAPERGKRFYKDVKYIYQLFGALSAQEIDRFKAWYRANNDVEKVCAKDAASSPVRYADIEATHPDIAEQLAMFFKGLYSQSLLDLAALKEKIGDIDDHYHAFVQTNNEEICPFCGINDLLGEYHGRRDAYDHYLPKALYPFNSINFRNLVPACHHCNSSYKSSKDPAHPVKDPAGAAQRRKVFYPYSEQVQHIEISVNIAHARVDALTQQDIDLQFGPASLIEEIETWRDVYGIDERYKAKLLNKHGKYWITQVLDEWGKDGKQPEDYLKTLSRQTRDYPFAEANFLKSPFLAACKAKGVFDVTS
jgi:hypothetical protein